MSLNRVTLMGRITADPELKITQSGISVTAFNLAVDRSYAKQGEEPKTDFFSIVCWKSTAMFVTKYFRKGSMIAIDGQLQQRKYQDREGNNRNVIEVLAEKVSFTGEKRNNENDVNNSNEPNTYIPPKEQNNNFQEIGEDDLLF